MRLRASPSFLAGLIAGAPLASCAAYPPRPLDPARTAAEFEARSLADPGLRAFAERNLPAPPSPWPPKTWSLPLLAFAAFYFHPDLDAARARAEVAEAGIVSAGARPNPRLVIAPGFLADTHISVSRWLVGVDLQIPIETAGKRGLRVARAERLAGAERFALAETAWSVWSGLRGAFLDHLFAARALEVAREEESARGEVAGALERRFAAGEASRPDLEEARAGLAETRRASRAAEGLAAQTRIALAASLGLPARALDGASFEERDLERPEADADLASQARSDAVLHRLDLRRALEEYAAADASFRLELAKQFPDLDLGPAYEFDTGEHKVRLLASLVVPLFQGNEGPIAEARARREESAARFLSLQARVFAETEAAAERCRGALAELAEAEASLEAAASRERAGRSAFEAGATDRLEAAFGRLARIAAERARLESARKARAALGALEDAVERPVDPATPDPDSLSSRPSRTALESEGAGR
ncbi:MAG TPA: TolC family protein [Planctomycetota bacterium]|nr:TolC family protein [Planctomycetota bacterium]